MYVKSEKVEEPNFLASAHYQNFTQQVSDSGIEADKNGRKIVKAGSVYKNSNEVAIGLVFRDVDVTNGPQPAAIMYQGIVFNNRLPEKVTEDEKKTMPDILFKDDYDAQESTP